MEGHVLYGHMFGNAEGFKEGIRKLDSLYKATKDLDYLSDKGLLLILLKQYDKAIELCPKLRSLNPTGIPQLQISEQRMSSWDKMKML